jgi:chromosome partitioning protein
MATTITVAIPKGGVGKTTTAVNLAATLAVYEKRTLLIDTDPAGACNLALGFTPENIKCGLYEVFNFIQSIGQAIHRTELPLLDFIPINVRSAQMADG